MVQRGYVDEFAPWNMKFAATIEPYFESNLERDLIFKKGMLYGVQTLSPYDIVNQRKCNVLYWLNQLQYLYSYNKIYLYYQLHYSITY